MATTTLKDLGIEQICDAPSGRVLPDDPGLYEVLEREDEDEEQREFIMARGPSGDVDVVVRDITGVRVYRDVTCESLDEFKASY